MSNGFKFGSREVPYLEATLKLKDLCEVLPLFEIFEKGCMDSLPIQKFSFYAKGHQIWFMGSHSESVP